MSYLVGTSLSNITAFKKGIGMMGYGMYFNTVHDVETPLFARAFYFHHVESGKAVAIVVCDMCFISTSVKTGVIKKLNRKHPQLELNEGNLLLSAQHTHSGPGGYNHHGLYNITIPGFVPEVYQIIVDGIVDALVAAFERKQPARLCFGSGEFATDIPVAFNRSMKAFMRNPEAGDLKKGQEHLAIDRDMHLLRIDALDGSHIGAINWFGVHTTSVHNDNHSICWDNKGYAADFLEKDIQARPGGGAFVGAFAQAPAGDVTPNYVWDKQKKWTRGPFKDDFESARHNGRLQYQLAREVFEQAPSQHTISGGFDWGHIHVNFANVQADPEYAMGQTDARTGPSCHGLAFFAGTTEGPGMERPVQWAAAGLAGFIKFYERATGIFRSKENRRAIRQKYKVHGKKTILVESAARRVLGTSDIKNLIVPGFADPTIANFKRLHPQGWDEDKPWTPQILPLQLIILGDIAFVAVPAEPTTVAGRRIRQVVEKELANLGIHKVIVAPYSNAYCGYITTYEEYQVQAYEGGHTTFGEWTLAAFQTKFRQLAIEMSKKSDFRAFPCEGAPPEFTSEELSRRTYGVNENDGKGEGKALQVL